LNMWPRARKWRRRRRQREISGHELTAGEGPSTAERDRDTDPNDTLGAQKLFQPRPAWGAPVDTSSAVGRAFYGMLAVFAAFETDVRRERQLECIAMAKREGIYKASKPRLEKAARPGAVQPRSGACSDCSRPANGPEFSLSATNQPRITDAFSAAPSCMSLAPSARNFHLPAAQSGRLRLRTFLEEWS
jgi:hypothetical protein